MCLLVASLLFLGMLAGSLLMSPMLDELGRRRTMMLVNVPAILGWLLIATASHNQPWILYLVYGGRLLTGLAAGLVGPPAVVYVGEVLDKTRRTIVVTWPLLGKCGRKQCLEPGTCSAHCSNKIAISGISLGIVMVYVMGSLFQDNWRLLAGVCSFFPAVSTAAVWYMLPESPVWLVSRGWFQEAEASMRRIRGVPREASFPDDLQQELEAMMHSSTRLDKTINWKDRLIFLKRPEAYKPLLIANTLFFFQYFSGIYAVIMYTVTIVRETGVQVDGYLVTVLIGIARLVMSFAISYVSTRCGRRLLFNISGVGMMLSVGLLAGFLSLTHDEVISPERARTFGWVPITALLLSVMMGTLGFMTLPLAMLGEIFPAQIRGWACGVTTFIGTIYWFLAVKLFPQMKYWIGLHNVCTIYTAVIAIGTVFVYFYLPETRGKTLKEIEDFFRGDKDKVRRGGQATEEMMPGSERFELFRSDGEPAGRDSTAGKLTLGPRTVDEGKLLGTNFVDGLS